MHADRIVAVEYGDQEFYESDIPVITIILFVVMCCYHIYLISRDVYGLLCYHRPITVWSVQHIIVYEYLHPNAASSVATVIGRQAL